jgi:hypothetical protein
VAHSGVSRRCDILSKPAGNQALNASLENELWREPADSNELNSLLNSVLDSASEISIIATDTPRSDHPI